VTVGVPRRGGTEGQKGERGTESGREGEEPEFKTQKVFASEGHERRSKSRRMRVTGEPVIASPHAGLGQRGNALNGDIIPIVLGEKNKEEEGPNVNRHDEWIV